MRRVVITGIGVVSCLGNSKTEVLDSLQNGRSGISFNDQFEEMGMRSLISGSVDLEIKELIDFILCQEGCYFSRITGSGSACIGIFSSFNSAKTAKKIIKRNFPNYWLKVSKTI